MKNFPSQTQSYFLCFFKGVKFDLGRNMKTRVRAWRLWPICLSVRNWTWGVLLKIFDIVLNGGKNLNCLIIFLLLEEPCLYSYLALNVGASGLDYIV